VLPDDAGVDPGSQVAVEAIGHGEEQVLDTVVLDDLLQQGPGDRTVVPAEKLTNRLGGDLTLEIEDQVVEEILGKLMKPTA
jgi:hypothetical protein